MTGDHLTLVLLLGSVPVGCAAQPEQQESWSRFRGPNGSGIAATSGLPVEFGPEKNVVWRRELPPGHSSPVLSNEHVFLTAFSDATLSTFCLDRKTGKVVWERQVPRARKAKLDKRNNAASATPAVDREVVVVFFEEVGLIGYDHRGEKLWTVPLGPFDNLYGMGASPVLYRDRVFLACDQNFGSFLIAVDKRSGDVIFKVDRPEAKSGHCTPIIYEPAKGDAQLILPGSFLLDSYDMATGKKIWWVRGLSFEMKSTPVLIDGTIYINGYGSPMNQPGALITVPTFADAIEKGDKNGDGAMSRAEMPRSRARRFFGMCDLDHDGKLDAADWRFLRAALASKNGMLAIEAGGEGDMTDKSVTWTYHRSVPQLPSPLVFGDVLYMLNDQSGLLTTLRPKTGEVIERGRLKDAMDDYYASPVAGDGKVYTVSTGGLVTVLPIGGALEPLATNDLQDGCFATPALADGRIYLRTTKALYCFGLKQ